MGIVAAGTNGSELSMLSRALASDSIRGFWLGSFSSNGGLGIVAAGSNGEELSVFSTVFVCDSMGGLFASADGLGDVAAAVGGDLSSGESPGKSVMTADCLSFSVIVLFCFFWFLGERLNKDSSTTPFPLRHRRFLGFFFPGCLDSLSDPSFLSSCVPVMSVFVLSLP